MKDIGLGRPVCTGSMGASKEEEEYHLLKAAQPVVVAGVVAISRVKAKHTGVFLRSIKDRHSFM